MNKLNLTLYENYRRLGLFVLGLLSLTMISAQSTSNVDLALRMELPQGSTYETGDIATFTITVFNQGDIPVKNVKIVDYLPDGLAFSAVGNAGWSSNINKLFYTISNEIAPNQSSSVTIDLSLQNGANPSNVWNYAEIQYAENVEGVALTNMDEDSQWDAILDNDEGAEPYSDSDNAIDLPSDEDDHDVALLIMCTETTCNGQVNISLNYACDLILTAEMIVQNQDYPNEAYVIISKDENGNVIPNNLINGTHLGQNLEVSAHLPGCEGLGCWGNALIEDKIAMELYCEDKEVKCTETDPDIAGFPVADDISCDHINGNSYLIAGLNGCSDIILSYEDEVVEFNCQTGIDFTSKIVRTWTATDGLGNTNTCVEELLVKKGNLSDLTSPPDYLENPIACGTFTALPDGNPDPSFSGYPGGLDCPNIIAVYEDLKINGSCAGRFDVLREWTVIDWCNGNDTTFVQYIKVMDSQAPICNAPYSFISGTESNQCGGPVDVPHPQIEDNCSAATYSIQYKLKDDDESAFVGLTSVGVTGNAQDGYHIFSLPIGEYQVVYFVSDECGNKTECVSILYVQDTSIPTTICKTSAHVTLDENGEAYLDAISLDDGSFDNCGIVHFKVGRMNYGCNWNTSFSDQVRLCCSDAGQETMVVFRVYDDAGNYNDCMVNVTVVDDIIPTIQCPPDATITCSEYAEDPYLTYLGNATATDNCQIDISKYDIHALTSCGVGVIVRTWTAIDNSGNEATCKQYIEVESDYQYDGNDINWPNDTQIESCPDDVGTDVTGEPILPDDACSDFKVTYKDQIQGSGSVGCYLIRRSWKVVDNCAVNNNENTFIHDQFIDVIDQSAPIFSNCEDVTIDAGTDCEEYVNLQLQAEDNCTETYKLNYKYRIDLQSDGTIDITKDGAKIFGVLPTGEHIVYGIVTDECGNSNTCDFKLKIKDNKNPTPVCLPISVSLGQQGKVEVWASDLDLHSFDNCHPSEKLKFSFSPDINDNVKTFTCSDLPNGIKQQFEVNLYVWDNDGNYDYCTTYISVKDALDVCPNQSGNLASISGMIMNHKDGKEFKDVMIELKKSDSLTFGQNYSDEDGEFEFDQLDYFKNYIVKPSKNDDGVNGVTTLDIIRIQKHILGIETIIEPQSLVAADVNNSQSISGTDIVQLRKLILGLYKDDVLPDNQSWRFYPSDFTFNENYPFEFEETIKVDNLEEDKDSVMFYGIKIGDINKSATTNFDHDQSSTRSNPVELVVEDKILKPGSTENIIFTVKNAVALEGLQFALNFDETKAKVVAVQSGQLGLTKEHYSICDGVLYLSWNNLKGAVCNEFDYVFALQVKVEHEVKISDLKLEMKDDLMLSEFIRKDEDTASKIKVRVEDNEYIGGFMPNMTVSQNEPNPFVEMTMIPFTLIKDAHVTFRLFSASGKKVFEETTFVKSGNQVKVIDDQICQQAGLYYLQIESSDQTETIKLIKVN